MMIMYIEAYPSRVEKTRACSEKGSIYTGRAVVDLH